MNFLIIGKFYEEGFARHIAETLSAMGHNAKRFEPGYRGINMSGRFPHRLNQAGAVLYETSNSIPAFREKRMRRLWQEVDAGPLDIIITCHDFLWPSEVAELKKRSKAAVVMWFPDALVNFGRSYFMAAPYDALFFKDPFIVRRLGAVLQVPVHYLPECFNPENHQITDEGPPSEEYLCDVTTAGNSHPWRMAHLQQLDDLNIKLWGPPAPLWLPANSDANMHQGRSVQNADKARAFRGAKIALNNLHYGEIWGLNVRAFEIAGIGAFQMIDWRPGLEQLFRDGHELVSFRGIKDLEQKICYWLPREEERKEISEKGKIRAYAEHSYSHRLELLISTIGGQSSGFPIPENIQ